MNNLKMPKVEAEVDLPKQLAANQARDRMITQLRNGVISRCYQL